MADITMPQLGETVTEGTITKWFKSVGDEIAEDEPLFEVSTDKVDSEVPSPASGYLAEILVEEGETVDVGTKLAVVSSDAPSGNGQASAPKEETEEDKVAEGAEAAEAGDAEEAEEEEEPPEQQEDDEAAEDVPEDETPDEEARPAGAEAEAEQAKAPTKTEERPKPQSDGGGGGGGGGKVLSPVVRKLISEHDLDPAQIEGTGQGGRITRADVLSFIDTGKSKPAPKEEKKDTAPAPAARGEKPASKREEAPAPAAKAGQDDEAIAFSNIRRRTAEHMVRSKATSAHVLTAIEADFENVDRVRRAAQSEWKEREGFTLTYLPFISRAVIDAIEDYPHVNASVGDDELIVHHRVHLGIAVDLSFQGLLAPVIHDADGKRLRAIAREVHDLAARARAKKLSADEIQGGTFTITNPGGYGTLITAPVINQPQVAILSTDGVKKKPVAVELPDGTDAVVVHPVGILALSFDHRAFDGAYASAFIARVKEILETRDWSQEL
ncbi:MAG: 2-oxo acid dehydrogenase subunit E2 [Acidimicrobiia bacterium]|nr:2-oxo acid dehydrogenase subunit E2 [Acidimicrobiia bacterium]